MLIAIDTATIIIVIGICLIITGVILSIKEKKRIKKLKKGENNGNISADI